MSTLNPKMCSWFYSTWLHISKKKERVVKGWKKCRLLHLFDQDFQREAMIENMKIPLFKHVEDNQIIKSNFNCGEEETNAEDPLEEVMMESLIRVEQLSLVSGTTSMATLRSMARKKFDL